jgi:hypothetical protein
MTTAAYDGLATARVWRRGLADARVLATVGAYFLIYLVAIGISFQQQDHFYGIPKADATSYVSHAFTIGLDGDLDYRNEVAFVYNNLNPAKTAPTQPMGMGILAAPFVAAFSLIDRANDHPVLADRTAYIGSWSYFGIQFATAFYFLAGIALYQLALGRWVHPFIVATAVISAGLLYYVTYQFAFVHAYEFFTLAALTAACVQLCRSRERWQTGALVSAIGAMTFLAFMVRWSIYGTLAVPLIAVLTHYLIERNGRYRRAIALSYAGVLGGLAAVALFHLWAFGIAWPTPEYFYGQTDLERLSQSPDGLVARLLHNLANLPLLLFSSEFGLLWTFPLFPIGCAAGLFALWRWLREEPLPWALWAIAVGWCIGVPLAIVLLWETTASGYGYRYLLPCMPALMMIMAIFLRSEAVDRHYGHKGEWASMVVGMVLVTAAFLALVSFVAQVGFFKLPGFTAGPQLNVFGKEHHASARGYMDAVFGAIARPSQWLELYQQSLFVRVLTPSVEMRAMPQLEDQFRVLLLVIPLIGAMFSAAAIVRDWRRFGRSAAWVLLAAALLWPLALRVIDVRERPLHVVAFGTRSAEPFVGRGFRKEGPGYLISWIFERPATIHGVLPNAPAVKISTHFYNPHPGQAITILLNGRQVGRWEGDVGYHSQSAIARLEPSEARHAATIQFLVDRIEPFEGSGNAALGVLVDFLRVDPAS